MPSTATRWPVLAAGVLGSLCVATTPATAGGCSAAVLGSTRELAHPVLSGAAGPFKHVKLTLTRAAGQADGPFIGFVETGARCLTLKGPDEPAEFFLIDVTAVLFAAVGPSKQNDIVVLYDSSRIGPQNGTNRKAIVYAVSRTAATRQPEIEKRLEGAASAAQVRSRLRTMQ